MNSFNNPLPETPKPPQWIKQLLGWFHPDETLEEVEGDLDELYKYCYTRSGKFSANVHYFIDVVSVLPPFVRRRSTKHAYSTPLLSQTMLRNYFKIAFRNLTRNRGYSFINIFGLATGMAVAMLIGLWVYDELTYNTYYQNHKRIAKVMQSFTFNGESGAGEYMPAPLIEELRTVYKDDFTYVVPSSWTGEHILAYKDNKFMKTGNYIGPQAPEMLSLKMLSGTHAGLKDPSSILLSESVAKALFGEEDPMGKIVKLDNRLNVKVTGVYEDMPFNTEFKDITFMAPWDLYVSTQGWVKQAIDNTEWENNSWQLLAQIAPKADFNKVSEKIKDIKIRHNPELANFKIKVFLHPMSDWHLYSEWDKKTGKQGGRIQFVWLFSIIGIFVLLLACINFMNLATARSEKRAKEVGIRKSIGSMRSQLIGQFFGESLLVTLVAFAICVLLLALVLPIFNTIADKQMTMPWFNPVFWLAGIAFSVFTGLIAGSYPALYLSSFDPVSVLKGTFRAGKLASMPRKVLVVVQFTVSITLIIGTLIVFLQIQYAKNRPVGYDRSGLITVTMNTPELYNNYNALRDELLKTGAVIDMSTSSAPATDLNSQNGGFEWEGKDPNFREALGTIGVSHDFGKTVGWQFVAGRDFSRQFASDSSGMVLNETAIRYMGLKDPVGKTIKWRDKPFIVVGVIKDMVMESPFSPISPTSFMLNYGWANVINIKLNPIYSARESLAKIETVFHRFNPGSPFDFKFTDQQYALKFAAEERIGTLASIFAGLAIFISCLGLFGMASFVAEQRTKEIGIRKVLGASVLNLWKLLSQDFVVLVLIAFCIATPIAWYFLTNWLTKYEYRIEISWWVFAITGLGALLITLLTVSFQSIKAALTNPVKSLRTE
ncbi:ABC transporter permease [Cytophagaceae bacterium DM2B3-1]|uniref:ABC transporter permease n=1 Tax=Xanthocytophaga flava TaxID=3048013 RepID=A0ABT7CS16_9BACT|nr:ABC transporter permease [Xanthocytophaga flavus]MDJ1496544.1 ABC transporter permease [Xanthocytophaga flavus]